MKKRVLLGDGSEIEVSLTGAAGGKVILLPGVKAPVYGAEADTLKQWGVDPEAGLRLVEGLERDAGVLSFDYEGHIFHHPKPEGLTPAILADDFLTIADAMHVKSFSYYGYSWLALAGLQLAIRTDRLESLVMGGFPPYDGPYKEMLAVTEHTYLQSKAQAEGAGYDAADYERAGPEDTDWSSVSVALDPAVAFQFAAMYRSLAEFDDRSIQHKLLALPRFAFAGERDTIEYGENFGGVTVDIIGRLTKHKRRLEELGWKVEILSGSAMDHTNAMQPPAVLPLLTAWMNMLALDDGGR